MTSTGEQGRNRDQHQGPWGVLPTSSLPTRSPPRAARMTTQGPFPGSTRGVPATGIPGVGGAVRSSLPTRTRLATACSKLVSFMPRQRSPLARKPLVLPRSGGNALPWSSRKPSHNTKTRTGHQPDKERHPRDHRRKRRHRQLPPRPRNPRQRTHRLRQPRLRLPLLHAPLLRAMRLKRKLPFGAWVLIGAPDTV